MPLAPEIASFGDGTHSSGETNLTIAGAGFGAFPGSAWIHQNDSTTSPGNTDELTINSWNDLEINIDIPASLTNSAGTVYLFVQREDLAWSLGFSFTISTSSLAEISGTAATGLTELKLISGGRTVVITVMNDTWVSSGASFNAQRQNIINGLDSGGSETDGWNNRVRDKLSVTDVERTSDTVVTITLPAYPLYDITANETITVTVPNTALNIATSDLTATPTFLVTADIEVPSGTFNDYAPTNSDTVEVPNNYEICDRSGFRVRAGTLKEEWNGLKVKPEYWEPRHPQDFVRVPPERERGSPRPEQRDRFIGSDLYPNGVSASDL